MPVAGIICEYNPFHAGHRLQLETVRARLGPDTGIVCLMSGNYVQRGEPAVYDKWARAEAAVRGGADLVLELPLTRAVSAAGYFAAGAVDCLAALGIVDHLCFGAETPEALLPASEAMAAPLFEAALQAALRSGVSYARARQQALGPAGPLLETPNNALGLDYLLRLRQLKFPMQPLILQRDASLPTATALRAAIPDGHTLQNGERAMLAVLRTLPDDAFRASPFGAEGLWSKVMKACRRENSLDAILFSCKSKRYTLSRLRRMLLWLFLGLNDPALAPPYLRVLAFGSRGQALLHDMKRTSRLPLLSGSPPNTPAANAYFALESCATDLYGLFAPPGTREPMGRERWEPPQVLPDAALR